MESSHGEEGKEGEEGEEEDKVEKVDLEGLCCPEALAHAGASSSLTGGGKDEGHVGPFSFRPL
jgi:hypothetical protein